MSVFEDHNFHLHSSYWTTLRPLTLADAGNLHQLSVAVNWPHRPRDMEQVLQLGTGVLATDEIGRPIGAGMSVPMGSDFAMIGLMMTHPRLQGGGAGRALLDFIVQSCGSRFMRLNATPQSRKLYRSAGFQGDTTVNQYRGTVKHVPQMPILPADTLLRQATPEDLPHILALDHTTFGADRRKVYDLLMPLSDAFVMERGGRITGFSMCRNFGRGRLIGPLIAPDERSAVALCHPYFKANFGKYLRLDTTESQKDLGQVLISCGMTTSDSVTPMQLGTGSSLETTADGRVYALASHAMG